MSPFITRTLSTLPSGPFDIQAVLGELALELAINWLTGDDLQAPTERGPQWLEAKRDLGRAMTEGQRVMGRRLMVGSIWVSPFTCRYGGEFTDSLCLNCSRMVSKPQLRC